MEDIKYIKRPRLKDPYFVVAWPGMGEVAFKAATYLVDKLKAEEFAQIPVEKFYYLMESYVHDGIIDLPEWPYNKFYFYKSKGGARDMIIFISDAQPDLARADEYCRLILSVAKKYKARQVVSFAAMPQAIDHNQPLNVWFTATTEPLKKELIHFVSCARDNTKPLVSGEEGREALKTALAVQDIIWKDYLKK